MNTLSKEENEKLKDYKVCVIGCGGLGGYIIEMLGRLGIGNITAVDGDVFQESNLNRQLLSDSDSIGVNKADRAKERMSLVNPDVKLTPINEMLVESNGLDILKGNNVVADALDNIISRLILQELCSKLNIPLVHGAIAGWYGQITTVFPGDNTLSFLYSKGHEKGVERHLGNPSFTPALAASIEVSEVIKILIGKGILLRKKVLFIDTLHQSYEVEDIG